MCIYTHKYTYIHMERSQLQYKLHLSLEAKDKCIKGTLDTYTGSKKGK